ncbi:MAG: GH116 family glycosyl hydrolase [Elusimicrobiota bacterium]|nr:GH116 family glycosyl hydrolase [Endomicrobiia bacterium]MDW8165819.1 GH116 family glycosyl hydrolase [Elusimicrobiota bacterium]
MKKISRDDKTFYFDEKNKEFIMKDPQTPTPWLNYLGVNDYCAMISNNAGGYSFYKSPKSYRILRYRYNNIPMDRSGRYIYLKEKKDIWSTSWQPVKADTKKYKYTSIHGLGYTKIICEHNKLRSEVLYFVPLDENLELWVLTLENLSNVTRQIDIFSYAEFCLFDAMGDLTDLQYIQNVARTKINKEGVIEHYCLFAGGEVKNVFAFTTEKFLDFDTNREIFIGDHRDESNPLAVLNGKCSCSLISGGNPIAAYHIKLSLNKKQTKKIIFGLGVGTADNEGIRYKKKYSNIEAVYEEFTKLKEYWEKILNKFYVETPDKNFNTIVNIWLPYQCHTTFKWSRSASYYETGTHRDGLGYRDSNQDVLAVIHAEPERVRKRILALASAIYKEGYACHTFQPITNTGTGGTDYSDDHLWLVLSTSSYIKETGDFSILDESVPYFDGGEGSLFEHLEKVLQYGLKKRGKHGISLALRADWNDCLNLKEGGESVWTTQLLYKALNEFISLCEYLDKKEKAENYKKYLKEIKEAFDKHCWDGEWYICAITNKDRKIGTKNEKYCKIYLNTNTWAVISGIGENEKNKKALDNVEKYLFTKYGLKLFAPGYKEFDEDVGAMSSFPAGLKENGGIFCHANTWAIISECIMGNSERAYKYFDALNPIHRLKNINLHKVEPYVYCQMIASDEHPDFGLGRNSWLTGTASWMYVAATQYILGVLPIFEGLLIKPCIPLSWKKVKIKREFRGCILNIEIQRTAQNNEIKEIFVNSRKIDSNIINLDKNYKTYDIKILLGK